MRYFLFFILFFTISCSATKKVYICGDRECASKTEAKKYFRENLSLEIKIINKKKEKTFNLIQMNTTDKNDLNKKKNIFDLKKIVTKKQKKIKKTKPIETQKKVSLKENNSIVEKKINEKNKSTVLIKEVQIIPPISSKENILIKKNNKSKITKSVKSKPIESFKPKKKKNNTTETYVCEVAEDCDIDKITTYLIKKGKDKKYPNITNE